MRHIPVFSPVVTKEDVEAVRATVEAGWISSAGPPIASFEAGFASFCGRKFCAGLNSGTSALEAAVHACGIKPGDEVILPAFTIVSCVNAIVANGGIPVFVDIGPHDWNIGAESIIGAISERTRAVMIVHMYGMPCDMAPILKVVKDNGIYLIEDASQVHGATVGDDRCGSFGDVSVFSFYANKIITSGEGGAAVTNNPEIFEKVKNYRNLYFDDERRFKHTHFGQNFRLTAMQAALAESQLNRIDEILQKKRRIAARYEPIFDNLPIRKRVKDRVLRPAVFWMNAVEFESGTVNIQDLKKFLQHKGIETRYFFSNLVKIPYIKQKCVTARDYTESNRAAANGLYFPSGLDLEDEDFEKIEKSVMEYFGRPFTSE